MSLKAPDVGLRDKQLAQVNAKIASIDSELAKIQIEWKKVQGLNSNGDGYKSLISKLNELRSKQSTLKVEKQTTHSKIKDSEASLKSKIANIQSITNSKLGNFKSIQDIDSKINSNEDLISNSTLTLVQEKSLLKENSNLRKLRKEFSNLQINQNSIDEEKSKINELKSKLTEINSNFKKINAEYDSIQSELNSVTKSNNDNKSNKNLIFKKREELFKEKDSQYEKINKIRSEFKAAYDNFRVKEAAAKKEKAKEEAKLSLQVELANASKPAFAREIGLIHALLSYFDKTYVKPSNEASVLPKADSSIDTKKVGRVIEAIDDDLIIKKSDEVFIQSSLNKKKHSKSKAKKFSVDPSVVSQLNELNISLPLNEDDYPKVVEDLKSKLASFIENEESERLKRIASVQKKIAALEKELEEKDKE